MVSKKKVKKLFVFFNFPFWGKTGYFSIGNGAKISAPSEGQRIPCLLSYILRFAFKDLAQVRLTDPPIWEGDGVVRKGTSDEWGWLPKFCRIATL